MSIINIILLLLVTASLLIIIFTPKRSKNSPTPVATKTSPSIPATQPLPPTPKKNNLLGIVGGTMGGLVVLFIAVFVIIFAYNLVSPWFEKEKPVVRTHTEIFEVPTTGTYRYLHRGWKDFPTGAIKIITPNKNELHDKPGEKSYFGYQPEGWYKFFAEEKKCQVKTEDVY